MKDKKEREDAARQNVPTVSGEAVGILKWLEKQFKLGPTVVEDRGVEVGKVKTMPDYFPAKIVMCPAFGRGDERGPEMEPRDWKPTISPVPERETLVQLANTYYGAAMKWCSTYARRRHRFVLLAFNNLKGPDAYDSYPFVATAGPRAHDDKNISDVLASDDENTHRDRLLETALEDKRWTQEQSMDMMLSTMKMLLEQRQLDMQQHRDDRAVIAQDAADRRAQFLLIEELQSKESERRIKEERARMLNTVLADAWTSVKGLLPGIVAYATKGKSGIVEGIKQFIEGLTDEQKIAMFGNWDHDEMIESGILRKEQIDLIIGIAEKRIDPLLIKDLITSLDQEQMMKAQEVLKPGQIQALVALVKAADAVANAKENGG